MKRVNDNYLITGDINLVTLPRNGSALASSVIMSLRFNGEPDKVGVEFIAGANMLALRFAETRAEWFMTGFTGLALLNVITDLHHFSVELS